MGWDTYKTINIKYANQVIGVKNVMTKQDSINAKNGVKDSIKAAIDSAVTMKDTSQIKN